MVHRPIFDDAMQLIYPIGQGCRSGLQNVSRFDFKQLKPLWTDNLILVLPFFDSFIAKNLLSYGAAIVPHFDFTKPVLFREVGSNLPFAHLIDAALEAKVTLSL